MYFRAVHTSDGVGSASSVTIQCKSKIGSGVESSTESESEGSEEFFRFRSNENRVNGIRVGSRIISQSKKFIKRPFR